MKGFVVLVCYLVRRHFKVRHLHFRSGGTVVDIIRLEEIIHEFLSEKIVSSGLSEVLLHLKIQTCRDRGGDGPVHQVVCASHGGALMECI